MSAIITDIKKVVYGNSLWSSSDRDTETKATIGRSAYR